MNTNHKNQIYKLEADFHDLWAKSVKLKDIDPILQFESPTAVEYRDMYNLMGNIKDKKVLVLGSGLGEEAVYLAIKGAVVTAIDISPSMIETTYKLSKKYKVHTRINCKVKSADCLDSEKNSSYDYVIGCNLLHHVQIIPTCLEVKRVLKKNGKAYFIEPLAYNPVINVYRNMGNKVRTHDEKPLTKKDISDINKIFPGLTHNEYHLFTLLIFIWFYFGKNIHPNKSRYWKKIILEGNQYRYPFRLLHSLDKATFRLLPFLKMYCWETLLQIKK